MESKAVLGLVLMLLLTCVLASAVNIQPVKASGTIYIRADGPTDSSLTEVIDWWPMFHHDLTHTGYSTSTAPNTNKTIWSYTTGLDVYSSPAVADGKVYIGSDDGKVYCLDAITGALIWSHEIGGSVLSSPAVAYGKVYIGSDDYKVYCLDATTGAFIWSYTTGGGVESSPAVADGKVYIGSYDHKVYCLDAITGALIWSYTTGYPGISSSPAVADGKVYIGSGDHNVYAFAYSPPTYDVTINAHCNTEGVDISVPITMDGSPTGYNTPHTFTGLTGTHTFTVPNTDPSGHPFKQWSTGSTSTTITVSAGGTYTAYYQAKYTLTITATSGGTTNPAPGNSGQRHRYSKHRIHFRPLGA
jgi:outer membrane protein assembly factor BamB